MLEADTLAVLYREEGPALLAFCARRTLDPDLALDMVGETFAVAFERRASFRGSSREEAVGWLFSIARSTLHHYYRRGGAEVRALARLGVEPPSIDDEEREAIEELADLTRTRAAVARELGALPADQQEAVRLRIVEELGYDELANRLGVSQQTARQRVSRGLRTLATRLNGLLEVT